MHLYCASVELPEDAGIDLKLRSEDGSLFGEPRGIGHISKLRVEGTKKLPIVCRENKQRPKFLFEQSGRISGLGVLRLSAR
jgi:hypothetical protein